MQKFIGLEFWTYIRLNVPRTQTPIKAENLSGYNYLSQIHTLLLRTVVNIQVKILRQSNCLCLYQCPNPINLINNIKGLYSLRAA